MTTIIGSSYRYDALNRLTSSPLGSYTYASASAAPLQAVTAVGSSYSASYNATGDMTCRAPASSTACSGTTPTGQVLGHDPENRLVSWQNAPSSPTTTASYAYDGAGQRMAQSVTTNGTTTTTRYLAGGLEEVTTSGSPATTTLTKYERVPGVCSVVIVGSGPSEAISYVMTDGLGSVSEALDSSGNVTAQQLYGPYGGMRYNSGTMPTAKGFTGQYADAASSGLDYYHARYYDPASGQFTSADTAGDGLNRYAYVHDDPETATDPTGHRCSADGVCPGAGGGGGGGSGGCGQCGKSPCAPNCSSPKQPPTGSGSPCGGCNARTNNPPPLVYDKNGKCATAYTCDVEFQKAKSAAQQKADNYMRDAVIVEIVSRVLALISDVGAGNLIKAIGDLTAGAGILDKYLVPLFNSLFGRSSWEAGLAETMIKATNAAAATASAFAGIGFMAGAVMAAIKVLTGPGGAIVEAISLAVGGVAMLLQTGAYALTVAAMNAQDQADALNQENTYQWCQTSSSCGSVNWNV